MRKVECNPVSIPYDEEVSFDWNCARKTDDCGVLTGGIDKVVMHNSDEVEYLTM